MTQEDEISEMMRRILNQLDNVIVTQAQHSQQLINLQSYMLMVMQQQSSGSHTIRSQPIPLPSVMPLTPMTRPAKCSYHEFKDSIAWMEVNASLLVDMQKDYAASLSTAVALHIKRQQTAEHDPPIKVCMQRRGEFQAYDGIRWIHLGVDEIYILFKRAMKRVLGWYSENQHDGLTHSDSIKQFDMNHMISSGIQTEKFRKTAHRLLYDALLG